MALLGKLLSPFRPANVHASRSIWSNGVCARSYKAVVRRNGGPYVSPSAGEVSHGCSTTHEGLVAWISVLRCRNRRSKASGGRPDPMPKTTQLHQ
jgi:hypothetical protein